MPEMKEILSARERRWQLRRNLARSTGRAVVCCSLVIPGGDKIPYWSDMVFRRLLRDISSALRKKSLSDSLLRDETTPDGRFVLLSVGGDPREIKKICVRVEDEHPLGRLADFDVMCENATALGRSDLGLPPRQCLVCSAPAMECIRSRRHSLPETMEQVHKIIEQFVQLQGAAWGTTASGYGSLGVGVLSTKEPNTRVEQAVIKLERMIFSGELESGAHIKELDIAEQLGLSRGVIREAFISLAQTGLVEIFPHRGVFVRSFTYEETLDFFNLRAHLALMAMKEAAQNISRRKVAELEDILDRLDVAIAGVDPTEMMNLNWEFHQGIYDQCENQVLKQLAADIRRKQFLSCRHSFRVPTTGSEANREHRKILKCLADGEGDKAGELMAQHIMNGKRRFLEAIKNKG